VNDILEKNADLEILLQQNLLSLPDLNVKEFQLIYISPVWNIGGFEVFLIGETEKIVHVSNDRILGVDLLESSIAITLQVC